MLKRIVNAALHFRGIIIALACILMGYGVYSIARARYDVYPNFIQPDFLSVELNLIVSSSWAPRETMRFSGSDPFFTA